MREVDSRVVAKAFGKHRNEAVAEGGLIVTKYGEPTVVMLPYADYERVRHFLEGSCPSEAEMAEIWRAIAQGSDLADRYIALARAVSSS